MQLQLVQLQETTTSYVATIQLRDLQEGSGDGGSAASDRVPNSTSKSSSNTISSSSRNSGGPGSVTPVVCSGLSAQPVVMVAGAFAAATSGAPTHEIVLSLAKPAGVAPFRLRLLHPVQASSGGTKVSAGLTL